MPDVADPDLLKGDNVGAQFAQAPCDCIDSIRNTVGNGEWQRPNVERGYPEYRRQALYITAA